MNEAVKALYEEAGSLLGQARAIVDEYEGQEMPAEQAEAYDRLMDAYDAKVTEAEARSAEEQRRSRLSTAEEHIGQPANRLPTPQPADGKGETTEPDLEPAVKAAWTRYLLKGMNHLTAGELKALQADEDPAGGFLVAPQQIVQGILKRMDEETFVRQFATVYTLDSAESLGVVAMDSQLDDATWTSELDTGGDDTVEPFGDRELRPRQLVKRVKISRKLLRQSRVDANALVSDRLAYKFAVAQENAFMTGSGMAMQPLGLFVASASGISAGRDRDTAEANAIAGDDLISLQHDVRPVYWRNGRFLLHNDTLGEIRKLKDGNGQYLWQPGLAAGEPATILNRPYSISEFAPNPVGGGSLTSGTYAVLFGDLSYYWIADALTLELQVLTELYAESNQIGYIGRLETDGMPVLEESFARLKIQ